jgi:hypothetical protein
MIIVPRIPTAVALMVLAMAALAMSHVASDPGMSFSGARETLSDKDIHFDNPGESIVDELQAVRTTLASARQAMASRDFPLASQLAEEASIDAQVAERHAQSTRSRQAAQESQNVARMLRAEIAQKALASN